MRGSVDPSHASHPPDILLTNYRMLDLLLQRPKDASLWAQNGPDTLRYLVLDELHTQVPEPSEELVTDLKKRIGWEATRELGLATRIGRTLEQSGCCSVTVDPGRFDAAVADISELLREHLALQTSLGAPAVRAFVSGLLTRMRLRGAVFDPLLRSYVASGGNAYMLQKRMARLLSPFGRDTNRPLWLTNARKPRTFDSFDSHHRTWLSDWVERALGLAETSAAADVYRLVIPVLTRHGILTEIATDESGPIAGSKASAWGLSPAALLVSRRHAMRRCESCGLEVACVEGSSTDPMGHACLRYRCQGPHGRDGRTATER